MFSRALKLHEKSKVTDQKLIRVIFNYEIQMQSLKQPSFTLILGPKGAIGVCRKVGTLF